MGEKKAAVGSVINGRVVPGPGLKDRMQEGLKFHRARNFKRAQEIYNAILIVNPDHVDAIAMSGVIALEERRLDDADRLLHRSVELAPNSPICHHNLGTFLSQLGRLDEAEGHYREAIRLKPDYAEAYFNLTGARKIKDPWSLIPPVEALLATKPPPNNADQIFLHFAANRLYDAAGDYDQAFEHAHRGNRARGVTADPLIMRRRADEIIAAFPKSRFRSRVKADARGPRPIFVVGMPRSGSSLVEQILSSHPLVHGAGELPDVPTICRTMAARHPAGTPYPLGVRDLPKAVLEDFAAKLRGRLRALAGEAPVVIDKNPVNFQNIGLIALMFPDARIIHCRRHPLDTCVSCYCQNFRNGWEATRDLGHLGLFYRNYRRLMDHWAAVSPLPILDVRYEDVIADPPAQVARLLDFCGLEWDDACLSPERTERPVHTASSWQVREPIHKGSAGRWKRYEKNLGPLLDIIADHVAAYEAGA